MPPTDRRRFWATLVTIAKPFFVSEARWAAFGMVFVLVSLLALKNGLDVLNNFVNRNFYTAIAERQAARFYQFAGIYVLVFTASTCAAVAARYAEERVDVMWRQWMCARLMHRYLSNHTYYRLRGAPGLDNPDQRMTDDVRTFTAGTMSIALILLNSAIAFVSFAGVLWSITPVLLLTAVLYAILGSVLTIVVGRPLIGLNFAQLRKEADLRYELIRVREHAEPIALARGTGEEGRRLTSRLRAVVDNFKRIILVNMRVGFFTNGYNYLTQIIPALIVAPLYMRGEAEFGVITQAAMAFTAVLNAFSVIVTQFQQLFAYAAVVDRVGAVWEAVHRDPPPAGIRVVIQPDRVAFEHLTLLVPGGDRVLIRDLMLEVSPGKRLLIRGPNGSGRTALLRAAAGLWTAGSGTIVRPPGGKVVALTQTPYLPPGTLRDQVLFPGRKASDAAIREALEAAGFAAVAERVGGLDAEHNWATTLSLGEQQQLAFARLFVAAPPFAVLDEATAALSPAQTRQLYARLAARGIGYLSTGNGPDLLAYHDLVLDLTGTGEWSVRPAGEVPPR